MKSRTILAAILMSSLVSLSGAETKQAGPGLTPAARANAIAFKFYAREAARPGNVFFSPYSIQTAFAMVYEGARGKTAGEIASVFEFQEKTADLRSSLGVLKKDLAAAAKGAEFNQANSFWAQKDYKFLPAYLKTLRSSYGAEARQVNFKTKAEEARGEINGWTEKQTKGKIKDLFPEGSLDPLSRLVLVNAVYFKGTWQEPFKKEMTADADFTKAGGEKVKVKMMAASGTRKAEYSENEELQVLRMPYKGGGLSMLALLPRAGKSLAETEKLMTGEKLESIRKGLAEQKVKVFLPKFTFSSGFILNDALAELGMPTAFGLGADFSGMDGTDKLYIQKAFHKAFVEVNEEGTEAAAATGVAMGVKSMPAFDFAVFRADRPFLFLIEDSKSGLILFMGRMEDPEKQ